MQVMEEQVPQTTVVPGTNRKVTQTTAKVQPKPQIIKALRDFFTNDPFADIDIEARVSDRPVGQSMAEGKTRTIRRSAGGHTRTCRMPTRHPPGDNRVRRSGRP